jgi:hypothetical protein
VISDHADFFTDPLSDLFVFAVEVSTHLIAQIQVWARILSSIRVLAVEADDAVAVEEMICNVKIFLINGD